MSRYSDNHTATESAFVSVDDADFIAQLPPGVKRYVMEDAPFVIAYEALVEACRKRFAKGMSENEIIDEIKNWVAEDTTAVWGKDHPGAKR